MFLVKKFPIYLLRLIELAKYCQYIKKKDWNIVEGILDYRKYKTLYDYYSVITKNWSLIISTNLPSVFYSIISYVLMIYFDLQRLEELYNRKPSVEVAATYIPLLTRQGRKSDILTLINSFTQKHLKQALILSHIDFLIWKSYFHIHFHEFEEAETSINLAEQIIQKTLQREQFSAPYVQSKATLLYCKALNSSNQRNHNQSLEESLQGINLLEQSNIYDSYLLGSLYNLAGNTLNIFGKTSPKENYEIALDYFSKNKIERGVAVCTGNIASLMIKEGKFELSLKYCFDFIDIMKKFKDQRNILVSYNLVFSCYKSLGKMKEAEEYLNHALNHMAEYDLENDDIYLSASELYALLGDFHSAEEYLKSYYDLLKVKEEEETLRKATWLIHKGFIELKKKNIYESENNLNEGIRISRETNYVPVLLQGLIYLIELFITKYKTEEDSQRKQEIFEEIELNSQECVILFREYKSVFQMVNYQLLQVTVYILMYKIELASSILERTINICKEFELEHLLKEAENKLEIVQELSSINRKDDLKEETDKLATTLEYAMMDYSLKGIKEETHISEIDDEQKIICLLVILPSGLPCYSFNFKESEIYEDELLVAGLIDAIQKFSSIISPKKGVFRMLEHSNYIILLESREEYTVALFTENFSYDLKSKLIKFADEIEKSVEVLEKQAFVKKNKLKKIESELDESVNKIFIETSKIRA